jgi:hypothetical protein
MKYRSYHIYLTQPTPEFTAEGAFEAMKEKVHLQWRDIAKVNS